MTMRTSVRRSRVRRMPRLASTKGVSPLVLTQLMSAWCRHSRRTAVLRPRSTAWCRAVLPVLSRRSRSAPSPSSFSTPFATFSSECWPGRALRSSTISRVRPVAGSASLASYESFSTWCRKVAKSVLSDQGLPQPPPPAPDDGRDDDHDEDGVVVVVVLFPPFFPAPPPPPPPLGGLVIVMAESLLWLPALLLLLCPAMSSLSCELLRWWSPSDGEDDDEYLAKNCCTKSKSSWKDSGMAVFCSYSFRHTQWMRRSPLRAWWVTRKRARVSEMPSQLKKAVRASSENKGRSTRRLRQVRSSMSSWRKSKP